MTFPGTGGSVDVPFSLATRVQGLTISKKFRGLLLQNKILKVTVELLSQSCTVVTWRYLEEWVLLQLSLPDPFFALKELMRGRYGTYLAGVPTSIQKVGFPELVCNCWCVESLPPPHACKHRTSPDLHLIFVTIPRVSDTCPWLCHDWLNRIGPV